MTTERHGLTFDRTANAVDDLGWDPDGTEPIDVPQDDGLLIEVPSGTYVFEGTGDNTGVVTDQLRQWGLRGMGDAPGDVTFRTSNGASTYFVESDFGSEDVLVENVTFDNTDDHTGGDIGNLFRVTDGLVVRDVDHVGFSGKEPHCRWSLWAAITDSDGSGEVVRYRKTGPSVFAGHGDSDGGGGVFEKHEGHLTFRECVIENQGGDGGLYTGKHPGSIVFDECRFANNDMATIRTAAGCELRNCTIVTDWENAHPDNVLDDEHPPSGTNSVYLSSAQFGKSGGGLYNCDIVVKSTYDVGVAAIAINNSDGSLDIHDTRIQLDVDGMPAIWARDPANQRFGSHETPAEPWGLDLRNVEIKGSGDCAGAGDGAAVFLENRHGTTHQNLSIDMPNARTETDWDGSRDVRAITDGGANPEHTLSIVGAGPGTGKHTFSVTVDGAFTGGDWQAESDATPVTNDDGTVTLPGQVVWNDGDDSVVFTGELVSVSSDSDLQLTVDGTSIPCPFTRDTEAPTGGESGNVGSGSDSGDGPSGSEPATTPAVRSLTDFGLAPDASPADNAQALTDGLRHGGWLYVPAGAHVCDAVDVSAIPPTTLFGPGTLVASQNVGEYGFGLRVRDSPFVTLDSLTLDGDQSNDVARGGVRFENCTTATLRNGEVRHWQDHDGVTDQPHAVNFVGCRAAWAVDNHVHHVGAKGINAYAEADGQPIDAVVMRGNYVHDTGEEALFAGSEVNTAEHPARFIIAGNHLRDNRSQYLVRVAGMGGENHTVIANNTALNAATAGYNYKTPDVTASSVVVANNHYRGGGRAAVSVQSTGEGHLAATVAGNRILGHDGDGILFESGCKNVLCYGNYTSGVRATATDNALVFGNMTYGYGLDLNGTNVEPRLNLAVGSGLIGGGDDGVPADVSARLTALEDELDAHKSSASSLREKVAALLSR